MTEEEKTLKELKELVKEANKRINALERLTGIRTSFATKQLFAYIENNKVQGVGTKIRKVRSDEYLTTNQQRYIIKALKDFLADEMSTIQGAKAYTKKMSEVIGKKISFRTATIIYNAFKGWRYYENKYDLASDFWQDVAPFALTLNEQDWCEMFYQYINKEVDEEVKKDAMVIYRQLTKD